MRAAAITVALMALLTTSAFARPHTDNGVVALRKLRGATITSSQGQPTDAANETGQPGVEQPKSSDLGVQAAVDQLTSQLTGLSGVTGVNGVGGSLPDLSGLLGAIIKLAGGQSTTGTEQSSNLGLGSLTKGLSGLTATTKSATIESTPTASASSSGDLLGGLTGGLTGGSGGGALSGLTGGLGGGANADVVSQLLSTITSLLGSATGGVTGGSAGGDLLGGLTGGSSGGGNVLGGLTGGLTGGGIFGRKLQGATITSSQGQPVNVANQNGEVNQEQKTDPTLGIDAAISELTSGLAASGVGGVTGVNGIGGSLPDVSGLLGGVITVLGGSSTTGTEQKGNFGLGGVTKTLGVVG